MTLPTTAYPPWPSLDPDPAEFDSEFVTTAVAAAYDLFDWYHDIHEPERGMVGIMKRQTAYAAAAIVDAADDGEQPTWGDVASVDGERAVELAEERGVADEPIEARAVALGMYGEVVAGLDWAADEADLDPNVLCFVHDGALTLEKAGKELWPDDAADADVDAAGDEGGRT